MTQFEIFAGINWLTTTHQFVVIDADGEILGERAFVLSGDGLAGMADWILGHGPEGKVAGVIVVIRWAHRRGTDDRWLAALLVAVAMANRIARIVLGGRDEERSLQDSCFRLRGAAVRAMGMRKEMKK